VDKKTGILELLRQSGMFEDRLYPVHRLDMVTSGLLLFARGRRATNELANHFRFGRIRKIYLALSDRPPHKKQGMVRGDMEKGRNGAWILLRSQKNPARTLFFSTSLSGQKAGLRLYVIRPLTGRTHQIRVALKSIAAPILGDPLYSRYDLARQEERTYLHAWFLGFRLFDRDYALHSMPREGEHFLNPLCRQKIKALGEPELIEFPGKERQDQF